MSYILEALRKSERARREIEGEPLARLASAPETPARRRWPAMILGLSVIVNVGALAYFFGPGTAAVQRPASPPQAAVPPTAPPEATPEPPVPVPPAQAMTLRTMPEQESRPPEQRTIRAPVKRRAQPQIPSARSSTGEPADPPNAPPDRPGLPQVRMRDATDLAPAPNAGSGPAPSAEQRRTSIARMRQTLPDEPDLADEPPSGPPAGSRFNDLKVNIYAYSPTASGDRFVVIRNRKYHEGDRIENGPVIRRIEERAMTLEADGETYRMPRP